MRNSIFYKEVSIPKPSDIFTDPEDRDQAELIEDRVTRITKLGEPITDGAPPIYTEAQEGVIPMYDVRTDKFDMALDEVTGIYRNEEAKRAEDFMKNSQDLSGGGIIPEE